MPWNPQVQDNSGQILLQGVQGLSSGLNQAFANIANIISEKKKEYQNGKIADSIVRANPEVLQALGQSPEQFGSLSAKDKSAAVAGAITADTIRKSQLQAQAMKAQIDQENARTRTLQQGEGFGGEFARLLQDSGNASSRRASAPEGMEGELGNLPPEVTMQSAATKALLKFPGAMNSPNLDNNLKGMRELMGGAGDLGSPKFTEDPVSKTRFATYGKIMAPSGVNPSVTQNASVQTIYDEDGNEYKALPDPKTGRMTLIKPKEEKPLPKLSPEAQAHLDEANNMLTELTLQKRNGVAEVPSVSGETTAWGMRTKKVPIDKAMKDVQFRIDSIMGQNGRPKAAASSVITKSPGDLPSPTSQAEYDALPSGTIYMKDGQQYRKK